MKGHRTYTEQRVCMILGHILSMAQSLFTFDSSSPNLPLPFEPDPGFLLFIGCWYKLLEKDFYSLIFKIVGALIPTAKNNSRLAERLCFHKINTHEAPLHIVLSLVITSKFNLFYINITI